MHSAIDRSSIFQHPVIDKIWCSIVDMLSKLSPGDHQKMLKIGIVFRKGTDDTKQVFLRDEAVRLLSKVVRKMRLYAHQVGIHPGNRDTEKMTSRGVWLRGGKIIQSGFSFEAMGKLYAFEDHPTHRHIAKHRTFGGKGP